MKHVKKTLVFGMILVAGVAIAKEGVQDPQVKARMDLMGVQAKSAKILGDMAGGKAAFDAAAAEAAKAALVAAAGQVVVVFEPQATDPVSEAKPEIWTNWADFTAKSEALVAAAKAIDASTVEGVQAGMGGVGAACGGCHKAYRM